MLKRKCSKCKKIFDLSKEFFHKSKPQDGGFRYTCKTCENKRHKKYRDANKQATKNSRRKCYLKTTFGISIEDYEKMLQNQNGLCFICNKKETATRDGVVERLAVDHCHKTGKVRSLLCQHCNTILGKVNEDIEILKSMINYIDLHRIEELR